MLIASALLVGCGGTEGDLDGDGFSAPRDCNDRDESVFPGADDAVGDAVDNNCDGVDGVDRDGDGIAALDSGGLDCDDTDAGTGGVDADEDGVPSCLDCDDTDAGVYPGRVEACSGVDDNCDGTVDRLTLSRPAYH